MFEQPDKKIKINCFQDVYNCMKPFLIDEVVEHLYIVLLNRNNQVLKLHKISSGGNNQIATLLHLVPEKVPHSNCRYRGAALPGAKKSAISRLLLIRCISVCWRLIFTDINELRPTALTGVLRLSKFHDTVPSNRNTPNRRPRSNSQP